ncbi:MAG: zinc ribbon domain-containing protein [Planctomycetota bacterium]
MPTYEYRCETNGRTLEVRHPMSANPDTWGELCKLGELDPGDTPSEAPVERLISLSFAHGSAAPDPAMGCGKPSCCMLNN